MPDAWYQQALTPPEVLEANLRVGVVPETDHVQVLVEVKDPLTNVQIAMESWPHRGMRDLHSLVEQASQRLLALLDEACEPF